MLFDRGTRKKRKTETGCLRVRLVHCNVVWLDVAVDPTLTVHVRNRGSNVLQDLGNAGFLLQKVALGPHPVNKLQHTTVRRSEPLKRWVQPACRDKCSTNRTDCSMQSGATKKGGSLGLLHGSRKGERKKNKKTTLQIKLLNAKVAAGHSCSGPFLQSVSPKWRTPAQPRRPPAPQCEGAEAPARLLPLGQQPRGDRCLSQGPPMRMHTQTQTNKQTNKQTKKKTNKRTIF